MSRTKKSAWNFSSNLLYLLVTLGLGFGVTPQLLKLLGQERYGLFQVLLSWAGYLTLFELGLSGTLQACLGQAVGRNDEAATRSYSAAGLSVYLRMALVMTTAAGLWIWAVPRLVTGSVVSDNELRWTAFLLSAFVAWVPLMVFRSLAEARQRSYVVSRWLIVQSVLSTLLLLVTAWLGWGLMGQAAATVLAQIPFVVAVTHDGLRDYPGILRERPTAEATSAIWTLNWPTFAFNVSGRISLLSDNLVIGWWLGPTAVAAFFLTQRLASLALSQLQGIGSASWASLIELHVQGHADSFRQRLLELTRLVSGLSLCVLAPIAANNHHFVTFWVGASSFAGAAVSLIACLNVWLWAILSLWGWPINGTGNIRRWIPYALLGTLVNIIVSIGATLKFGLIGPLLGTLTAFILVYSWSLPLVLKELFAVSRGEIWCEALAPMTWGVPYVIILQILAKWLHPEGWIVLLAEMGLAGLCGLALWWKFSLSITDRELWAMRIRLVLAH